MTLSPLLSAIGNLPYWFEALDNYRGPEDGIAAWLCSEWSVYREVITEAEERSRLFDAHAVIEAWRAQKLDATLADLVSEHNEIRTHEAA